MAIRITSEMLTGVLNRLARTAERVGFPDTDRWVVEEGAPSAGRAWRLFVRDTETHGLRSHPMTLSEGWIGNTRREAYEALGHMARTLEAVAELNR